MVADLLQMSRYGSTGAEALKNGIDKIFEKEGHLPIQNYKEKMVSFKSDGASANTRQNEGLMTRMKRDRRDWLVSIHCVNHRVELVIKDSFDESPFSAVDKLYITLFNLFKNSGAIKSDIRQAAEVLEISVYTLPKLMGIVKRGKNGTNLTNLSIIHYLLWPSLPHFLVLIHWSLAFMNK